MNETKERVKGVVQRLVENIARLREVKKAYRNLRPAASSPASEEEIRRYEKELGVALPKTFRAFLELHNGYSGLTIPGSMLSIQSVRPGGEAYSKIKEWKLETARYGSAQVLDGIVIASMDGPNQWAFLDPNRPTSEGELTVVSWQPDSSQEFPDLIKFFEELIDYCHFSIARATGSQAKPI